MSAAWRRAARASRRSGRSRSRPLRARRWLISTRPPARRRRGTRPTPWRGARRPRPGSRRLRPPDWIYQPPRRPGRPPWPRRRTHRARGVTPLPSARNKGPSHGSGFSISVRAGRGNALPLAPRPRPVLDEGWIPRLRGLITTSFSGTAQATTNGAGGVPATVAGTSRSARGLPVRAEHPEHHDVVHRLAVACQPASTPSRRKPARSSAACERPLRVFDHAVRRSSPSVSKASAATSALDSGLTPSPRTRGRTRCRPWRGDRAPRARTARSRRSARARGGRSGTPASPRARACRQARDVAGGSSTRVYGPHENQRVTPASAPSSSSRGASSSSA